MDSEELARLFPEVDRIEDDDLRRGVIDAWVTAVEETGIDDLESVPWFPPSQRKLDIADETLVFHVRDVTLASIAIAELLIERRDADLSMDTVIAGALVHDVSKLYEFDGMEDTEIERLLGHPHYGLHVVAAAGLPVEIQHILLAHTRRTSVEPATLAAVIVRRADEAAASAIRAAAVDDLRDA